MLVAVQTSAEIDALNQGVLAQLNAEISAAGLDVKKLAVKMGADYNTFRRYMNGEREIPMHVFWAALKELGVDTGDFMREAQRRARLLSQPESH
jgi:transcriptional regulator with XRE-family HTH domain